MSLHCLYTESLSVSGTPGSSAQRKLPLPWISGAFFITVQNPTKCAKKCGLLARKGEYPQPSLKLPLWTVLEGWICQMAVRADTGQSGCVGGEPELPLVTWPFLCTCPWMPSTVVNQTHRPPGPGNRWVTPQLILLANGVNEQDLPF